MEEDEDVLSSNDRADTVPVGRVVDSGSYFTPKHTDQLNSIISSSPASPFESGPVRWIQMDSKLRGTGRTGTFICPSHLVKSYESKNAQNIGWHTKIIGFQR